LPLFSDSRPWTYMAEELISVPAVSACVNLLMRAIAQLPAIVYAVDRDQRRELYGHPIARLLDRSTNLYQSGFTWMSCMVRDVCLAGNGFSLIERDPDDSPMALLPVKPAAVSVRSDGMMLWYEVTIGGERFQYPASEVLHFKMISEDGIRGVSMITPARRSIELAIEQETAGLNFFRNNATPTGVIHMPHRLAPEQARRLRDEWQQNYAGHRRRVAILEEGCTFEPMSPSFESAEWLKSRVLTGEDICRFFGILPTLVGYSERSSYSSSESEWAAFLATSLGAWLRMIETELAVKLLEEGQEIQHDTRSLVRANLTERYSAYDKALSAGWASVNEVRRWEGLAAAPGGDLLRTPTWLQTPQETTQP